MTSEACAKLEKEIRALADEVNILRGAQESFSTQLDVLKIQIAMLHDNLRILKREGIVTVLSEFKKAREELDRAERSLPIVKKNYLESTAAFEKVKPKLHLLLTQHKEFKLTTGKVIPVDFKGKQNGQK